MWSRWTSIHPRYAPVKLCKGEHHLQAAITCDSPTALSCTVWSPDRACLLASALRISISLCVSACLSICAMCVCPCEGLHLSISPSFRRVRVTLLVCSRHSQYRKYAAEAIDQSASHSSSASLAGSPSPYIVVYIDDIQTSYIIHIHIHQSYIHTRRLLACSDNLSPQSTASNLSRVPNVQYSSSVLKPASCSGFPAALEHAAC